jgi:hypothetical protein
LLPSLSDKESFSKFGETTASDIKSCKTSRNLRSQGFFQIIENSNAEYTKN